MEERGEGGWRREEGVKEVEDGRKGWRREEWAVGGKKE
jgi:hypothetical protein